MSHVVSAFVSAVAVVCLSAPLLAATVVADSRKLLKTSATQAEGDRVVAAECLLQAAPSQHLARGKTMLQADDDLLPGGDDLEADVEYFAPPSGGLMVKSGVNPQLQAVQLNKLAEHLPIDDTKAATSSVLRNVSVHFDSFGDEAVDAPSDPELPDDVPGLAPSHQPEIAQFELLELPAGGPLVPWLMTSDANPQRQDVRRKVPLRPSSALLEVDSHLHGFGDQVVVALSPEAQELPADEPAQDLPTMDAAPSLLQISQAEDQSGDDPSTGPVGRHAFVQGLPIALTELTLLTSAGPALLAVLGLVLVALLLRRPGVLLMRVVGDPEDGCSARDAFVATDRGS